MNRSSFFTGPIPRRRSKPVDEEAPAIAIFAADDEPIGSRILYVNDAFVRQSGYTAEQLVGHSAMLLAGARPRRHVLGAALAATFPFKQTETKVRPDGSSYDVEVTLEALPRANGRPLHIVLTQRLARAFCEEICAPV